MVALDTENFRSVTHIGKDIVTTGDDAQRDCIKGAIITIDAMGCQNDIASKLIAGGADYVLGVKDNQPGLAEAVELWFDAADEGKMDRPFRDNIQTEKDHGRIETRRCLVTNDVAWLSQENQRWAGVPCQR